MARPQTASNGQLVPMNRPPEKGLAGLVQKMGPEIARALPRHLNPDRMTRIALTALRATPKLQQCTPASFLGSVMSASQLGLEPNTPLGHAYLLPYKTTCQLIIGYQGMIELVRRSGSVTAIYAHAVKDGDEFDYELGLNPTMRHRPSDAPDREDRPITHVYAVAKLKDGEPVFTVLTLAQINKARARSMSSKSGPWVTDFEAMACKTAVRRLFKWLPKSPEVATAVALDEAPEAGQAQSAVWAPEITEALESQGLDTEGEALGSAPTAAELPDREPGED